MQKIIVINRIIDFFIEDYYINKTLNYSESISLKQFEKLLKIQANQIKRGICSKEFITDYKDVKDAFIKWKTMTSRILKIMLSDDRMEEIVKRKYKYHQSMIKISMEMFISKETYYLNLNKLHNKFIVIGCYAGLIKPFI